MGQKTNPTALRLEKTNLNYTGCWYSDRFYLHQLHNNYKIHKYITKVFYKVKKVPYFKQRGQLTDRVKPLIYRKVGHQINQIFCIFPRYKKKYFYSWKKDKQKNLNYKSSSAVEALRGKVAFLYALAAWRVEIMLSKKEINLSLSKGGAYLEQVNLKYLSVAKKIQQHAKAMPKKHIESTSLVKALFYKHSNNYQILEPFRVGVSNSFRDSYMAAKTLSKSNQHHQSRLEWAISHNSKLDAFSRQSKHPTLPPQEWPLMSPAKSSYFGHNLVSCQHDTSVVALEKKDRDKGTEKATELIFSLHNAQNKSKAKQWTLTRLSQITGTTRQLPIGYTLRLLRDSPSASQNVFSEPSYNKIARLYPVKVDFAQQNSGFLAQRVCNGLKNRFNFPRLRRTILWDIKKSLYVKGVRVTVSGRLETRSKKAQKARSRTFQWGQTELHVLSSLVQFTRQDLVTPRGKIGVKVWVCYGV